MCCVNIMGVNLLCMQLWMWICSVYNYGCGCVLCERFGSKCVLCTYLSVGRLCMQFILWACCLCN